jgi:transposase
MNKYTIQQFNELFPSEDACLDWLRHKLYPQKIYCINCKKPTRFYRIKNRKAYGCDLCGRQISPTANTIFDHSPTPLRSWFYAIYLMSTTRCGISAKQLQRELGVTYKTAWRMFHQIRSLLQKDHEPTFGKFEMDETYIGGKSHGKRGRGAAGKSTVLGIAQREGDISAIVTPDLKRDTLYPIIREHITPDSIVYTDEYRVYDRLRKQGYHHKRVYHSAKVWALGDVHTNTIEGFWSVLKRGINGVYHAVSQKHLQSYVNEYSFRYNHRQDETPMFLTMIDEINK